MTQPNNNLIPDSLEYYDKNTEKYDSLFNNIKYIKFVDGKTDMDYSFIYFYDENKKEILHSRYENIGVYNNKSHTWTWAWSVPVFFKNTTQIARKIINYGMELGPESKFLKTELITSRFRITNFIQLDMHVAIASYLSKRPVVYKYISYMSFKADVDRLVDITNIPEYEKEDYTIYYMFLLDYDTFGIK
jgi:hypothetical protein